MKSFAESRTGKAGVALLSLAAAVFPAGLGGCARDVPVSTDFTEVVRVPSAARPEQQALLNSLWRLQGSLTGVVARDCFGMEREEYTSRLAKQLSEARYVSLHSGTGRKPEFNKVFLNCASGIEELVQELSTKHRSVSSRCAVSYYLPVSDAQAARAEMIQRSLSALVFGLAKGNANIE